MTYDELLNKILGWTIKYHPDWDNPKLCAVEAANALLEGDDYDFEWIDAGICPRCEEVDCIVQIQDDQYLCTSCGEIFTEIVE